MALHNQHKAIGSLGRGADGVKGTVAVGGAPGSGRGMTITPVRGLGAYMPKDLDGIVVRYIEQVKEDRRLAAKERAAERLAHWY
jgi:hypothetical protein